MSTVTKEQLIVKLFRLGCFKEGNVTLNDNKADNISYPQGLFEAINI